MKKLLILMLAVLFTAGITSVVMADGSGLGIIGSPHDFTDDYSDEVGGTVAEITGVGAWNLRAEICRVCHVPHDHHLVTQYYLEGGLGTGLLWNHAVSSETYTMYDNSWSSTLDNTPSLQPDGIAKLCLGCHDGTVALDAYGDYAGTAGNEMANIYTAGLEHFVIPGFDDLLNKDLRGTHPISIPYNPAADTNLNPTTQPMGNSGTIADVLNAGKVQCSSCHDVHDQESVNGTHLLRVAQTTAQGGSPSGLCLTCHAKDQTYSK